MGVIGGGKKGKKKPFCSPNWQRDYKQWFGKSLRHPTLTWTEASLNICQNKQTLSGIEYLKQCFSWAKVQQFKWSLVPASPGHYEGAGNEVLSFPNSTRLQEHQRKPREGWREELSVLLTLQWNVLPSGAEAGAGQDGNTDCRTLQRWGTGPAFKHYL